MNEQQSDMKALPVPLAGANYRSKEALSHLVECFRRELKEPIENNPVVILASWRIWSLYASVGINNSEAYWAHLNSVGLTAQQGHVGVMFQEWISRVLADS